MGPDSPRVCSLPCGSPTYPTLASAGAYSPQERFTADDLADVVEYARARGVRIMMEIDTPGHAASWCNGHPEICPSSSCPEPLNPATEATFTVLSGRHRLVDGVRPRHVSRLTFRRFVG